MDAGHPDLAGRIANAKSFVPDDYAVKPEITVPGVSITAARALRGAPPSGTGCSRGRHGSSAPPSVLKRHSLWHRPFPGAPDEEKHENDTPRPRKSYAP
ncbi:hypothetical protein [Streptomyces sp. 3214.6]|uniref:hypothetical protein n=1 Tax=Streptomyces sp. 3214.6 TaxID=1882757 RepID=UPI003FA6C41C